MSMVRSQHPKRVGLILAQHIVDVEIPSLTHSCALYVSTLKALTGKKPDDGL